MRSAVASVLAFSADAVHRDSTHGFLSADLRPDVAAHLLVNVEDEWQSQATVFAECNSTQSDCGNAPVSFTKSCGTVVGAVVKASSGNKASVVEYMNVVCQQAELQGWRSSRCGELASTVANALSADDYQNRENFQTEALCKTYWTGFATRERERVEKDRAEREAQEAKEAAVRAEEEKKAAAEAEQLEKDQERKEAQEKAEEAKQKAEEAAADFAKKKEEAERQAKEASAKVQEAKDAAEVARKHKEEKTKALTATATNGTASAEVHNKTETTNATVVHNSKAVAANATSAK